jgi:hypothetical protein
MSSWIRSHLRWVLVGCAAVFLFVAGGTAYAAFVVNSNADVASDTISGHAPPSGDHSNLIAGSVANSDLAPDSVLSANIKDGAVTRFDLSQNSVNSARIVDGTVGNADLGTDSVDGTKVKDGTITGTDVANQSLSAFDIGGIHTIAGSNAVIVNDPVGGGATNTPLVRAGDLLLNSRCTNAGGGSVTAEVDAVYDFTNTFVVTSDAPGGTTNTAGTVDPVQVANFGPTTAAHLGTGKVTMLAQFEPLLTGVLTVGTHVLGHDCVFAANSLG